MVRKVKPEKITQTDATNLHYAKKDFARWQQMWFIIGFEVRLSNNRDQECKMCIHLKGKYPKYFFFTGGWHSQCRCTALPILAPQEVRDAMMDYQLGLVKRAPVVQYITSIPEIAKDWIMANTELVAGSMWYRDNKKYMPNL